MLMKEYICGLNGWNECDKPVSFNRVSRWITIQHNYNPCKRNRLWDFVQDENGYKPYQDQFNPENGLYLDWFKWNGKTYAVEQFYRLGSMFVCQAYSYETKDGKECFLSGVDMYGDLYNPIYVEFDECCERVRIYERG